MNKPKRSEPNGTYPYKKESYCSYSSNNGFWDRDPQDRAARMDAATNNGEKGSFFDLPPEERARAYDQD